MYQWNIAIVRFVIQLPWLLIPFFLTALFSLFFPFFRQWEYQVPVKKKVPPGKKFFFFFFIFKFKVLYYYYLVSSRLNCISKSLSSGFLTVLLIRFFKNLCLFFFLKKKDFLKNRAVVHFCFSLFEMGTPKKKGVSFLPSYIINKE